MAEQNRQKEISEQDAGSVEITSEDEKEIEAQIAELSLKNRSGFDALVVPAKKELFFPIVVNILVFGIAAGVLFSASRIFSGREQMDSRTAAFSSVEGNLIRQLRQDSEVIISNKDQEIVEIRKQLEDIEAQKLRQLRDFDEQLKQRESAFREQVLKDVEAERVRLSALGMTQAQINALLKKYEQERYLYYQQRLTGERDEIQKNFDQLQAQYQERMRAVNDERRSIQTEVLRQETAFRESAGGAQNANLSAELEQARAEILRINENLQKDAGEEAAVLTLYGTIRANLLAEQFTDAITNSDILINMLANGQSVSQRRGMDRYLASSLKTLAYLEIEKRREPPPQPFDPQTQARIAELEEALEMASRRLEQQSSDNNRNLAEAVNSVRQARVAAEQNNTIAALNAYQDAGTRLGFSAAENASLVAGITALTHSAVDTALSRQKEELSKTANETETLLQNRIATLETALNNLRQASLSRNQPQLDSEEIARLQTRASALEMENARLKQDAEEMSRVMSQENAAVASRITALYSYLNTLEAENARLKQSNDELTRNATQNSADASRVAAMQTRITELAAENTRLKQSNDELARSVNQNSADASRITAMQSRVSELETENARLKQSNDELARNVNQNSADASRITAMQSRINELEAENTKLKQTEQELNQNLIIVTDNYNRTKRNSDAYIRLTNAYTVYKENSDSLSELEHFLNTREASSTFPGIAEKVKKTTDNLIISAHKENLGILNTILETSLRIKNKNTRDLYLEGMKVRYINDRLIGDFIDILIKRLA
jgi:hypothetical protein